MCFLFHSFYTFETKEEPTKKFDFKGFRIPKLFNNPLASCSLRNFDFLLFHTEHFNNSIFLPFFYSLQLLDFYCLYFFYALNNKITLFYIWFKLLFITGIFDFFFNIIKFFWYIIFYNKFIVTNI